MDETIDVSQIPLPGEDILKNYEDTITEQVNTCEVIQDSPPSEVVTMNNITIPVVTVETDIPSSYNNSESETTSCNVLSERETLEEVTYDESVVTEDVSVIQEEMSIIKNNSENALPLKIENDNETILKDDFQNSDHVEIESCTQEINTYVNSSIGDRSKVGENITVTETITETIVIEEVDISTEQNEDECNIDPVITYVDSCVSRNKKSNEEEDNFKLQLELSDDDIGLTNFMKDEVIIVGVKEEGDEQLQNKDNINEIKNQQNESVVESEPVKKNESHPSSQNEYEVVETMYVVHEVTDTLPQDSIEEVTKESYHQTLAEVPVIINTHLSENIEQLPRIITEEPVSEVCEKEKTNIKEISTAVIKDSGIINVEEMLTKTHPNIISSDNVVFTEIIEQNDENVMLKEPLQNDDKQIISKPVEQECTILEEHLISGDSSSLIVDEQIAENPLETSSPKVDSAKDVEDLSLDVSEPGKELPLSIDKQIEEQSLNGNKQVIEKTMQESCLNVDDIEKSTTELKEISRNTTEEKKKVEKKAKQSSVVISKTPNVPCHILGRNIDNPQEDLVNNGRTPPKPRLGVKVPYRNLTSQIVTKQDIANELIERAAKRNPDPDPPLGGDVFFAKKLTQRLAKKIALKETKTRTGDTVPDLHKLTTVEINPVSKSLSTEVLSSGIPEEALSVPPVGSNNVPKNETINDNSDLLAILEGDVEVDWTKEIRRVEISNKKSTAVTEDISHSVLIPESISNKLGVKISSSDTPAKLDSSTNIINTPTGKKILDPAVEREIALKQLEQFKKGSLRGRKRKQNLQEQIEERKNMAKDLELPVEQLITTQPEEIIPTILPKIPEASKEVQEITAAVLEVVKDKKEFPGNKNIKAITVIDGKKKPTKSVKQYKGPNKPIIKDVEPTLTPRKVTKTYSRKVALVNVPDDLVQFVSENDPSALIENINSESKELPSLMTADKELQKESKQEEKPKANNEDESNKKVNDTEEVSLLKNSNPKKESKMNDKDEKTKVLKKIKPNSKQTKKSKRLLGISLNKPEVTLISKRARIIKKKVIWDPDEVPKRMSTLPSKKAQVSKENETSKLVPAKGKNVVPLKKIETVEKEKDNEKSKEIEKSTTKLVKEKEIEKTESVKKVIDKQEKNSSNVISKTNIVKLKKGKTLIMRKKLRSIGGKIVRTSSGELKRSLAVISKKKKHIMTKKIRPKLTELDKLLMDEGAVNMLYYAKPDGRKKNKKKISIDQAQKELRNKIRAVKDVITMNSSQEDSPKALRKKDSPIAVPLLIIPPRKKSRDSLRSSIQSPPPSPSFMYPHRAEASRIIRRHSSSFSSECSTPRRMSLDQTEKTEATKSPIVEEKKEAETPLVPKRKKGVPIFIRKANEKTYKGKRKQLTDAKEKAPENKVTKESEEKMPQEKVKEQPEVIKEKLSVAEKRKLNTEMSKNFTGEQIPKKRTRSSKLADEEVKITETSGTQTTPKSPLVKTKKSDKFNELVKNDEGSTQSDSEKLRVSSRQIAMANNYKEISLRKIDNLAQVILTPTTTKIKSAINLQMFRELSDILSKLSKDDTCRVVLVSSTDNYFCHGLDFSFLISSSADKRLSNAQEMAKAVREFLQSLATFPKPLVAGVQGSAVGIGVTMLALFDLVLASDKATFITPYSRLGQVPEGALLLTSPHLRGNTLISELLFACRKLTASEAMQHGLVTRVLWPDKFQEELIPIAKSIATQSAQSMIATKSLLRQSLLTNLNSALDAENKLLVEQWTSVECQQNFKKFLQENEWW